MHLRHHLAWTGRFLETWGRKGTGRGEFDTPHGLAMDSRGRLFVADLRNRRVQIFEQDGRFVDEWRQFGMPGGIFIDVRDRIYVADSLSSPQTNAGWIRGIRVGDARDGSVSAFIPDASPEADPITAAEGVAVDAQGNIYGAVVPTPGTASLCAQVTAVRFFVSERQRCHLTAPSASPSGS